MRIVYPPLLVMMAPLLGWLTSISVTLFSCSVDKVSPPLHAKNRPLTCDLVILRCPAIWLRWSSYYFSWCELFWPVWAVSKEPHCVVYPQKPCRSIMVFKYSWILYAVNHVILQWNGWCVVKACQYIVSIKFMFTYATGSIFIYLASCADGSKTNFDKKHALSERATCFKLF